VLLLVLVAGASGIGINEGTDAPLGPDGVLGVGGVGVVVAGRLFL